IVRDPIAIAEYLGTSFNEDGLSSGPARPPLGRGLEATPQPGPPEASVTSVVEREKVHRLIERLMTDDHASAKAEWLGRGRSAVPALLEALERRDVELRRRVSEVLQALLGGALPFDPYAPEAQRRQQIAALREKFERKAG